MLRKTFLAPAIATVVSMLMATPLLAQSIDYTFDISLGIAKIGEMRFNGNASGGRYSVAGRLYSTGVAGALYDVSYTSSASGTYANAWQFSPSSYSAESVENGKTVQTEIRYSGNRVSSVQFTPERSVPSSATSERNTVDPATLTYLLIRPVAQESVCGGTFDVFDGHKRATVSYTNARRYPDGSVECDVRYSSNSGKGGVAPSSVVFKPGDNGMMYIHSFSAKTNAGSLVATRR